MTTSTTRPQSIASLHGLRDAIEQAERQLVRLDRTNIQQFLVLLDQIEQMWTQYDDPSAMSAEEARWQSLLKRIAAKPQLITTPAVQAGGLAKLRSQNPPATGIWWHVDEQVAGQNNKMWRRLGIGVGVVALVVVAFWLINFLTPHNSASAADASQQIEQLVGQHNWQAASTVVETARKSSPNDVDLMVWEAVLAEQLGHADQAQSSLTQAQSKFTGTPAAFWTLVGSDRLDAGNLDGADQAAQQALKLAADDAQVTFLLGRIAEARGDMAKANAYYNQTIKLAGNNNPELVALVKVRMGLSSMTNGGPVPNSAPVPNVTQTITP